VEIPNYGKYLKYFKIEFDNDAKMNISIWQHTNNLVLEDLLKTLNSQLISKPGFSNNFIKCFGPQTTNFSSQSDLKKAIIQILLQWSLNQQMQSVQFIDDESLADLGGGVNIEERIMRIKGIVREMKRYPNSMLIFDVDALCPTTKQFSSLKSELTSTRVEALLESSSDGFGGITFQYNMRSPELLDEIINRALNLTMTNNPERNMCWVVFLTDHRHLTSTLKDKLNWPNTLTEVNESEQRRQNNKERLCKNCGNVFTNATNSSTACSAHIGMIGITNPNSPPSSSFVKIEKDGKWIIQSYTLRDVWIRIIGNPPITEASLFKWTCCGSGLFSKGEIQCPHEEEQDLYIRYMRENSIHANK